MLKFEKKSFKSFVYVQNRLQNDDEEEPTDATTISSDVGPQLSTLEEGEEEGEVDTYT
jgi:hypothetical protein